MFSILNVKGFLATPLLHVVFLAILTPLVITKGNQTYGPHKRYNYVITNFFKNLNKKNLKAVLVVLRSV